ncbi:MAG: ABC transporter permease [Planctomycetes bacterium]|nr:ABC transporter permease [Planctomycetota bacterium]MBL7038952.1 ABC transporter permease [Pirellulaceae bacterium]
MLMQLIRKDLRICRLPILVGVAMVIGAFVLMSTMDGLSGVWRGGSIETWSVMLKTAGSLSIITSIIALTMLAGTIFAAERADRSSEFLAYLPPSRAQVLLSKAIVLGASCVLALCVGGGSIALADWLSVDHSVNSSLQIRMRDVVPIAVVSIGVGWCASARFANTGPSVGLGFAAPIVLSAGVLLASYFFGIPNDESFRTTYAACSTATGLACLVGGSVYFIRRVEP